MNVIASDVVSNRVRLVEVLGISLSFGATSA